MPRMSRDDVNDVTEDVKEISVEDVKEISKNAACTKRHYVVTYADLPLSCPPRDTRVWDAHPRIYMPIEQLGKVTCPYCDAEYVLKDFIPTNAK